MDIIKEILKIIGIVSLEAWLLYVFYFKKNLEGQINEIVQIKIDEHRLSLEGEIREKVEKEVSQHSLLIGYQYNRQMADYTAYVNKKHKVYSEFSEKITIVQALLHTQDGSLNPFNAIGLERIKKYDMEGTNFFEKLGKKYVETPESKRDMKELKKATEVLQMMVLPQVIQEMNRCFYLNKIYFSEKICSIVDYLITEFNAANNLIFAHELKPESITGDINKKTEELIFLMRDELSAEKSN